MRVMKSNICEEDRREAFDILNKLRSGKRVFGEPAAGLKKTLVTLESQESVDDDEDSVVWKLRDGEYEEQVAKVKKGIKGEETLAEYFEKLIKLDDRLSDMIVFASLGKEDEDKDYIPDTDFLCVYGNYVLIVDAKAVNTNSNCPLFVNGNGIYAGSNHNTPIIETNPSTHVWRAILQDAGVFCGSIDGCCCIVNRSGAIIFRNNDWYRSDIKPVHISELYDYLIEWVEGKDPTVDLYMLKVIAEQLIHKEADTGLDLSVAKRMFGV